MSKESNKRKTKELGMPHGTAAAKLRKLVLFDVLKRHGENVCHQCGHRIETAEELSIEHKDPWLGISTDLFWDLNNIAFSHLRCNAGARRSVVSKHNHGTIHNYQANKCRCDLCRQAKRDSDQKYRLKKIGDVAERLIAPLC